MRKIRNLAFLLLCVLAWGSHSTPVSADCDQGTGTAYVATAEGFCDEDSDTCEAACGTCGEDFVWCGGENYGCSGGYWEEPCGGKSGSPGCWLEDISCDCNCNELE
jgi:hypothetical protein